MKTRLPALVAALGLTCASAASAGTISPELQQAAMAVDLNGDLPVIIQFAEEVDKEALRDEANLLANERYPDDTEKRDKEFTKVLRKTLVQDLKEQARDTVKQIDRFLKTFKEKKRPLIHLWAINAVAGNMPADRLRALASEPGVVELRLDARMQSSGPGTPPGAPTYWNINATGVDELWQLGHTGTGMVVATLDTGVDPTHPDLGPRWRGGSNSWFDPNGQYTSPADNNGHGTQVMGLILGGDAGGYQIGMAPDATWIAAKIFDDSGQATLSGIHLAYQWTLDPDNNPNTDDAPDIVNNSWDLTGTVNQCNQEFAPDLAFLVASDIAVVFAGGNYGPNPQTSVSPANDPSVMAVGSIDSALNIDIDSARGVGACGGGIFPHLVAPGDGVLTADRMPLFYNFVSGTSFAVAHVAGAMAVLKGAFPQATVSQLRTALTDTASDLGTSGPDNDFGHGLIDLPSAHDWLEANLGGGDPGTLQLAAATLSVDEDLADVTVTVTRTGGSTGDVSVDYATSDGTATAGADYQQTTGTLTLLDGEVSGSFVVPISDDSLVEGDESFTVTLTNAVVATLGTPDSAQVTIVDDDASDSDGDGVSDALDLCPNTPAGEPVDANGCSASQLDADNDGVMDSLDQCPNTPAGEPVDANGCSASQLDSDGDGVSDALDLCPATPAGEPVDTDGCADSQLPPTAVDDTAAVVAGSSVDINVLSNDTDPDGDPLSIDSFDATGVTGGSVTCTTGVIGGNCTYTAAPGQGGTVDTFSYVAAGGPHTSNAATVTVTVSTPNQAPTAQDDATTTDQDVSVVVNVLTNDTDPENDPLSITAYDATGTAGGNIVCETGVVDGSCTFTPASGFSGTDTFMYMATDGQNASNSATVTVTVIATVPNTATDVLHFSTVGNSSVPGVAGPYDDADIYTVDSDDVFSRRHDGINALGLPVNADIDGLSLNGTLIYVSFAGTTTSVPGLGNVPDEDVVVYDAITGNWSNYFDGSLCGLDASNGRDVDAVSVVGGTLYFSTLGGGSGNSVGGVSGPWDDADVYTWSGGGANSCGRALDVRGSGVPNILPGNADVDGLTVISGTYYMSFNRNGGTNVSGLGTVQDEAVVSYDSATGNWTLLRANSELSGTNGHDVNAVHVP